MSEAGESSSLVSLVVCCTALIVVDVVCSEAGGLYSKFMSPRNSTNQSFVELRNFFSSQYSAKYSSFPGSVSWSVVGEIFSAHSSDSHLC